MFVQIIEGTPADAGLLRRQWERWNEELRPGAEGFLGSTGGITTENRFLLAVRFSSEEAARRNSDRPEQGAWWAETEKAFDGPASFAESSDLTILAPDAPQAGFVQMMQAKVKDREAFEELEQQIGPEFMRLRPDVLGAVRIWLPGPRVQVVDYFSSEAEARAGEAVEMPDAVKELFGRWMGLLEDIRWNDVPEPWLAG